MGAGRPSEYNFEMCEKICEEVANGFNIKSVLASDESYPTFPTWCKWKREHPELFNLYVNSMQDKSESADEELDQIYSMLKSGELEPSTANVLIQTIKWRMGKWYPKMFGDKVQQEHSGEINNPSATTITFKKFSKEDE